MTRPRRWAPLLALALVLAGCGASATARTPAASPAATSAPAPAPTATPPWTTLPNCGIAHVFDYAKRLGDTDFVIAGPALANLAYPGKQIPDGTPLKPLQVAPHPATSTIVWVNPALAGGGGYNFALCNGSPTHSHTISAVSFRIESIKPYTGQLNEWPFCDSFPYHPGGNGVSNGGCGGGNPNDEWMKAAFAAGATQGTTVTTEQVDTSSSNLLQESQPPFGPVPVSLKPGEAITFNVALDLPNPSATYTFSVGISLDSAPPVFSAPTEPVLLAPATHLWDGAACLAPDMQSQIPPDSDPQSAYICPAS